MNYVMSIGGIEVPVEDFSFALADERSTVGNEAPRPAVFEALCEVELNADMRAWLDGFKLPTPPVMKFEHVHHAGILTTTMEVMQATAPAVVAFNELMFGTAEVEFNGRALRMQYERGGDKTAWDPGTVTVGFCVDVEGTSDATE
jgi:hypothetical protein